MYEGILVGEKSKTSPDNNKKTSNDIPWPDESIKTRTISSTSKSTGKINSNQSAIIIDCQNTRSYLSSKLSLVSQMSRNNNSDKKRPLSISSVSSSSSSSCSSLNRNGSIGLGDTKKSYLASIESLDDAADDDSDDDDSLNINIKCPSSSSRHSHKVNMNNAMVKRSNSNILPQIEEGSVNQSPLHHHHDQSYHHLLQSKSPSSSKQMQDSLANKMKEKPLCLRSDYKQSCHSSISSCSSSGVAMMQQLESHNENTTPSLSSSTTTTSIPKYWDNNLSHIDRVILEIVETERTYVMDLKQIIEGYLFHLNSLNESAIGRDQVRDLFSNIEQICEFNSNFFAQLEQCSLQPVAIAKCFLQNSSGFDIYTEYCTNYPRTVSLLTDMMRETSTAEILKQRQIALKHSLPLGSYLLKPVQRILKYHLLLQNIVKHWDKDSADYIDIKNALSVMTNMAYHINDMKRKHEHAVRVQEIQSLLYNWEGQDLTTYGDLQCEGSFRMFGAKAFRHLFLFDKMLLISKKKDDGILNYKAHIMCSNLMLIESIQKEPLCFHAIPFDNPRVQYTFQARNLEQKREWCLLLKRVILESYNVAIPSHAKQIVMELGQTIHNKNNEKTHSGSKRTMSAPEYLERRKQERKKNESMMSGMAHGMHKGFKLRKSLKKIQVLETGNNNGSRRARSASHDESALRERDKDSERRSSLGVMELNNSLANTRCNTTNSFTTTIAHNIGGEKFVSNAAPKATSTAIATSATTPKQVNITCLTEEREMIECECDCERERANGENDSDIRSKESSSNDIGDNDVRPPTSCHKNQCKDKKMTHISQCASFCISDRKNIHDTHMNGNDNNKQSNDEGNDQNGSNHSMSSTYSLARTGTPSCLLSSGSLSSELSMSSSQSEDNAKYVILPVNALNALNATGDSAASLIRRVHSFNTMGVFQHKTHSKPLLQHTLSLRHSPTPDLPLPLPLQSKHRINHRNQHHNHRPTTLDLTNTSCSQLSASSSLDEMSPIAPAIWLKRQEKHFAINSACATAASCCQGKGGSGGSLPRCLESSALEDAQNSSQISSCSHQYGKDRGGQSRRTLASQHDCDLERPFTITSDTPLKIDFIDDNLEIYVDDNYNDEDNELEADRKKEEHFLDIAIENANMNAMKHECCNSPEPNLDEDDNEEDHETSSTNGVHHPEHKVYKQSAAKYLKSMFSSVSFKFGSLRKSPLNAEQPQSGYTEDMREEIGETCVSPTGTNTRSSSRTSGKDKDISPKLITAKFVHSLARAYSSIIKSRLKGSPKNEELILIPSASQALAEIPSPVFARIAVPVNVHSFNQDNSSNKLNTSKFDSEDVHDIMTSTPKHGFALRRKLSQRQAGKVCRPDSLLSEASNSTISSEGTDRTGSLNRNASNAAEFEFLNLQKNDMCFDSALNDDSISDDVSDSSMDSFYEKTIEAIESVLAHEMFSARDSAIYSDQEDNDGCSSSTNTNDDLTESSFREFSSSISSSIDEKANTQQSNMTNSDASMLQKLSNIELLCAKRVKGAIIEKLRVLEENAHFHRDMKDLNLEGLKSIQERRKELEKSCAIKKESDQLNGLNEDVVDDSGLHGHESPRPNTKGWVKHMVGKLQSENDS